MRLGGPILTPYDDPEQWVDALNQLGYTAAYAPELKAHSAFLPEDYVKAAHQANIVIAEVGAWSNPIDPNDETSRKAIAYCQERLAYADQIQARCCVNIAGSRGSKWDGPHPDNLTEDTFALIVDTVRSIIDAVKPRHSFYTLETMPWVFPESVDSYLRLIKAIDRKQFAVHLDPVNIVSSPSTFFNNGALLKDCFKQLGPYIKSCHAKDITLAESLTVHLDETRPGLGGLDYKVFLQELNKLDLDSPLMLEHLPNEADYAQAASYIRSIANESGVFFV